MIDFCKKDTLNSRQRLSALIAGEPIDRVPFNPFSMGFSARLFGIDRGEFYRQPDKAFAAGMHLMETYPWMNCRPSYGWADRGSWEFGGKIIWPDDNRYIAPGTVSLLSRPDQIFDLAEPDPEKAGMAPLVDRFNELSIQQGFPASLPGGTPTTLTAGIIGRSNFLRWLVRYPEAVHALQEKVTRFLVRTAEVTIKKYGARNCSVFCGVPMETNQLIPEEMFESYAKPYIQEIFTYYQSAGVKSVVIHLCGDHTANLPHWQDIPLPPRTVFSIGHEMDLEQTGVAIGKDCILAGNVNNKILHRGTEEAVITEVERCLTAGKRHPGGFVLMPACELPPDTPIKNLEALAQTLYEKGYF